jgi:hypothetical protein
MNHELYFQLLNVINHSFHPITWVELAQEIWRIFHEIVLLLIQLLPLDEKVGDFLQEVIAIFIACVLEQKWSNRDKNGRN